MRFTAVFLSVFAMSMICGTATFFGPCAFAAPPDATSPENTALATPSEPVPATTPGSIDLNPQPETATPPQVAPQAAAMTPLPSTETSTATSTTTTTAFQNGIAAYQKNDFKSARSWFSESASKDPQQIVAWYNLGLTEQKLGNAGLALAFWRKALAISPNYGAAKYAVEFSRPRMEHPDIPHEVETWETLRSSVLVYASSVQLACATLVIFFLAAWLALAFIGRRRRALLDEKPLPAPPIAAVLASLVFLILFTLTICKVIDDQDVRATVIVKKVDAKALPDQTSTSLFELYEGLEVVVRQINKQWIQVTYPGGATGWIPRESVFTMTDRIKP